MIGNHVSYTNLDSVKKNQLLDNYILSSESEDILIQVSVKLKKKKKTNLFYKICKRINTLMTPLYL